jgi:hypothetical protein
MDNEYITSNFWEYIQANRGQKPIFDKVYNWLNRDNLGNIVISDDSKVYWLELTCSLATLPEYIRAFIKKWCKAQGYEYLYDKYPPKI